MKRKIVAKKEITAAKRVFYTYEVTVGFDTKIEPDSGSPQWPEDVRSIISGEIDQYFNNSYSGSGTPCKIQVKRIK